MQNEMSKGPIGFFPNIGRTTRKTVSLGRNEARKKNGKKFIKLVPIVWQKESFPDLLPAFIRNIPSRAIRLMR